MRASVTSGSVAPSLNSICSKKAFPSSELELIILTLTHASNDMMEIYVMLARESLNVVTVCPHAVDISNSKTRAKPNVVVLGRKRDH